MNNAELRQMARLLRTEAEELRRHGLTNFFEHTYACARYGQAHKPLAERRCVDCPMRPFVPAAYQEEAFACQHITPESLALAAREPDLAEKIAAVLLDSAAQLEAEAG